MGSDCGMAYFLRFINCVFPDRTALVQARKEDKDRMDEKLRRKLEEKSRKTKEVAILFVEIDKGCA